MRIRLTLFMFRVNEPILWYGANVLKGSERIWLRRESMNAQTLGRRHEVRVESTVIRPFLPKRGRAAVSSIRRTVVGMRFSANTAGIGMMQIGLRLTICYRYGMTQRLLYSCLKSGLEASCWTDSPPVRERPRATRADLFRVGLQVQSASGVNRRAKRAAQIHKTPVRNMDHFRSRFWKQ
jgi:hypothetical protein